MRPLKFICDIYEYFPPPKMWKQHILGFKDKEILVEQGDLILIVWCGSSGPLGIQRFIIAEILISNIFNT